MCEQLGMPYDESAAERAVQLRNNLMHEARWDGGLPGEKTTTEAFLASYDLHGLATRLIFHILSVDCKFRETAWTNAANFSTTPSLDLRCDGQ